MVGIIQKNIKMTQEKDDYILKLETLILNMSRHCICERNTYGFDYHETHPKLGRLPASRFMTPNDLLDNSIGFKWQYATESGCGESWKAYNFKILEQRKGFN
jgi:hypothetical protein